LGGKPKPLEEVGILTIFSVLAFKVGRQGCFVYTHFGVKVYNHLIIHYNLARAVIYHTFPRFKKSFPKIAS
jgi:hypothetical protein